MAPDLGRAGGGGFRKYRFILFKHPWHRQGPQNPQRGGERPQVTQRGGLGRAGLGALQAGALGLTGLSLQVSDFLSGRSPLTLALRVGDHMMFVQLQLAAQHAPLQHRHVLAAAAAATRGDPSMTTTPVSSPCRPVSSAARVPPVPTSPAPASSPVTAGSFHSHSASTTCPEVSLGKGAAGGQQSPRYVFCIQNPIVFPTAWACVGDILALNPKGYPHTPSSCALLLHQQMDCSSAASTGASPTSPTGGNPTSRSRKPGAVIESFVNHAPGVFSGTFSGRCQSVPMSGNTHMRDETLPGVAMHMPGYAASHRSNGDARAQVSQGCSMYMWNPALPRPHIHHCSVLICVSPQARCTPTARTAVGGRGGTSGPSCRSSMTS